MSYQPLARKYRPRKFADLVGQDAVARALSNAIKIGRAPAAVLFAGIRGIGKTTTARLYAKALNCDQGPSPEPCDECASCQAISGGYHEDVMEIDGASHNGVDEVRALKETIGYVPQRSLYKIYIIDEVHMLSLSAFNALLKTLEEPPPKVVFIFATTELQKVPQTIVGRCQTFHLQKLSLAETSQRLGHILHAEAIPFDPAALPLVARQGRGSMRDALTFLDQVIALGGGKLTQESLAKVFSAPSTEPILLSWLKALVNRQASGCLEAIARLDQAGCDFLEMLEALAHYARHGFILQGLGAQALGSEQLQGLSDGEKRELQTIVGEAHGFDLNRIFRSLLKCRKDLDGSELDRFVVENYCLEWCLDPGLPSLESLLGRQESQPSPAATSMPSLSSAPKVAPPPRGGFVAALAALEQDSGGQEKKNSPLLENPPRPQAALAPVLAEQAHAMVLQPRFPASWEALIEGWKQQMPLQARRWEEAYVQHFSPQRIEVAVKKDALLAKEVLDPQQQQGVKSSLATLFGFRGQFIVSIWRDDAKSNQPPAESLLEIRQRRQNEQAAQWLQAAQDHPLTLSLLKELGGRVEKVSLLDSELSRKL